MVGETTGSTIGVLAGDGTGGLAGEAIYGAGAQPRALSVLDATGDGAPGVVVTSILGPVHVLAATCDR